VGGGVPSPGKEKSRAEEGGDALGLRGYLEGQKGLKKKGEK